MTLAANALCSLNELKNYLNMPTAETSYDTVLELLINMASDVIEQFLGTPVLNGSYTEKLDGDGTNVLVPRHYPIISVSSLKVDGEAVSSDDYYVYEGYIYSEQTLAEGHQNIELIYTAGWGATMSDIPLDLKLACIKLASYWYRRDVGAYSHSFGEPEEVRGLPAWSMPAAVRSLLEPYAGVKT